MSKTAAKASTGQESGKSAGIFCKVVFAVLLLRLCIGWHFFREGSKKFTYDADQRALQVTFSAEGFFKGAKGPLAGVFKSQVPGGHDWYKLLVVPRELKPLTEEQQYERTDWINSYNRIKKGQTHDVDLFPEIVPYSAWGKRIEADRRETLQKFIDIKSLSEEQKSAAAKVFEERLQQVSDFLVGEWDAMKEYQHDLWKLEQKKNKPEVREVPFEQERHEQALAKTSRRPLAWVGAVGRLDELYTLELRSLVTAEQLEADAGLAKEVDQALAKHRQQRMDWLSRSVAYLITGVGICLLLGLFTRLASLGGALFLLSVLASQPPWVAGANTGFFYYQLVEIAVFIALAAGVARQTPGVDYVFRGLWCRCCGAKGAKS